MIEHVAIVGAGFSGTLAAINLVRHDGPRAVLIDRQVAGTGLAFGAAHPTHLLNVRAANMSAFPDDAGHFVRWLEAQDFADAAQAFVPRTTYGRYLRALLDEAVAKAPDRLTIVQGEVVDLNRGIGGGSRLILADGTEVRADAAVLAVGNLPPHAPPGIDPDALPTERYVGDCWSPGATAGLGVDDTVLILGTGLTMVDVALLFEARGFDGRIIAMSRRGLVPHDHAAPGPSWVRIKDRPARVGAALLRDLRQRSDAIGWRNAVDELRPFTQDMWRAASHAERAQFIRHVRPWWDIHRHRLAPQVAARIAALRASGRLTVVAGKTLDTVALADGVAVAWRPRGAANVERMVVQRVINCTGPQGDLRRVDAPLLQGLARRGVIRPDQACLGIDVDEQTRTVSTDGSANDWLFALGPMTRGAFWEIVAVPDIRGQAWTLARRFSNAYWVAEACRTEHVLLRASEFKELLQVVQAALCRQRAVPMRC